MTDLEGDEQDMIKMTMCKGKDMIKNRADLAQRFFIVCFLAAAVFILMMDSPLHIWRCGEAGSDSSVFKTVALMMRRGYMPYRDSFDHKGPLLYLINYAGDCLSVYRGVWLIEYLFMWITFAAMYRIARIKCGRLLSCLSVLISSALLFDFLREGNLAEEYALPFITVSLFIFLDYFLNERINAMRLIVCGFCFGSVCMLKFNMISVWIVFCIAVLINCIKEKKFKLLVKFILQFLTGACLIVAPILIWLTIGHSLKEFWECYLLFNLKYISGDAGLSQKIGQLFFYAGNTVIFFALLISVYYAVISKRFLYVVYAGYLVLTLCFTALSGLPYRHYGMMLVPATVFPTALLFAECKRHDIITGVNVVVLLTVLYFGGSIALPVWMPAIGKTVERYEVRGEKDYSPVTQYVCALIEENTSYNDKISVYGQWDMIYVMSGRMHSTRYSYQFPIGQVNQSIMDEYFQELTEELPKILVVQSGHYDDRIQAFLRDNHYISLWAENKENPVRVYRFDD